MLFHAIQGAGGFGGGGPIAYKATSSANITLPNTVTINFPAGTKNGDLVIAFAANDSQSSISGWTAPSGWTQAATNGTLYGTGLTIFYRFYTSAMGSSVTFTGIGSDTILRGGGVLNVYENVSSVYSSPLGGDLNNVGPTYPFPTGSSVSSTFVVCLCINDDDEPTSVTQSGFTTSNFGYVGSTADNRVGYGFTYNSAFTGNKPPNISMNGVSGEPAATIWFALT